MGNIQQNTPTAASVYDNDKTTITDDIMTIELYNGKSFNCPIVTEKDLIIKFGVSHVSIINFSSNITARNIIIDTSENIKIKNSVTLVAKEKIELKGLNLELKNCSFISESENIIINCTSLNTEKTVLATNKDIIVTADTIILNQSTVECKHLLTTGKSFENVSSSVNVQNMTLNCETNKHYVKTLSANCMDGRCAQLNDYVYRENYFRFQAVTPESSVIIKNNFETTGKTTVDGIKLHCKKFIGTTPSVTTITPYTISAKFFTYPYYPAGGIKEEISYSYATPIVGVFSSQDELKTESKLLVDISGIISASCVNLKFGNKVSIGHTTNIMLPQPREFKTEIPLTKYMINDSKLYTITTDHSTVYKSLLPDISTTLFGPIRIKVGNAMTENTNNLRTLFTKKQEMDLLAFAMMSELGRGFFDPTYDIEQTIIKLKEISTEEDYKSKPYVSYSPVDFIHQSGTTETVLVPSLNIPESMNNKRIRDYAGGIFALGALILDGTRNITDLTITGHLETSGEIFFSNFNSLTHVNNVYTTKKEVVDYISKTSWLGFKNKIQSTSQTLIENTVQPGNTITSSGVSYENIGTLSNIGLKIDVAGV